MAKFQTGISIDEKIYNGAKAVAEHDRRNFSTIVEIALEQLIKRYEKLTGLSFLEELPLAIEATSVETPEIEGVTR